MSKRLTGQQREVIIQSMDDLNRIIDKGHRFFRRFPTHPETPVKDTGPDSDYWLVSIRAKEYDVEIRPTVLGLVSAAEIVLDLMWQDLVQDEIAKIQEDIDNREEK